MSYFGKFSLVGAYIGSLRLAMSQTIDIDYDSNAQKVDVIGDGFVGTSDGSEMITIQIDEAIPVPDFEVNPSAFHNKEMVLTFAVAGKLLNVKGIGVKWKISQGTNASSKASFTVWCRAGFWE